MAKINHLEMGADVLALQDVQVKKGFMGLTVKLIYQPTNSVIKIKEKEYSAEDGRKLENILSAAPKDVEAAISKFPVSAISMGNMKLQACISDDHQFVATQLLAFKDFGYKGSDYRLKRSAETASHYTLPQLEACLQVLLELDQSLKSQPVAAQTLLETALCRLALAGSGR